MGYRTYIGKMPRSKYNKIKSLTKEQLIEYYNIKLSVDEINEGYLGLHVYSFGEKLFEFGKYNDFDPPKKSGSTFFKKKDVNFYFTEEHDFMVVKPEFLEYLIEYFSQMVKKYYSNMINPFIKSVDKYGRLEFNEFLNSINTEYNHPNNKHEFDLTKMTIEEQTAFYNMFEHIRTMSMEWGVNTHSDYRPFYLEQNSETVISSTKYEYIIFELVKIYNRFDWKKNVMFFYGY